MKAVERHGSWPTFDCNTCQTFLFDEEAGEIARRRKSHDPEPPCNRCTKGRPSWSPRQISVKASSYYFDFFQSGDLDLLALSDRVGPRLFEAIKVFKGEYEAKARELIQQQKEDTDG